MIKVFDLCSNQGPILNKKSQLFNLQKLGIILSTKLLIFYRKIGILKLLSYTNFTLENQNVCRGQYGNLSHDEEV